MTRGQDVAKIEVDDRGLSWVKMSDEETKQLINSKFWEKMTPRQIAEFQIAVSTLVVPWDIFKKSLSEALGRGVYSHEFGLNVKGLREELNGTRPAPSLDEILDLIPEEKRITVIVDG